MKKSDAPLTTKENLLIGGAQVVEQMVKEHKPDEEIEKATAALHTIACDGDLERAKDILDYSQAATGACDGAERDGKSDEASE